MSLLYTWLFMHAVCSRIYDAANIAPAWADTRVKNVQQPTSIKNYMPLQQQKRVKSLKQHCWRLKLTYLK